MIRLVFTTFISGMLFLSSCKQKADLILTGATIYTVDSSFTKASCMVVTNGKIVAIGQEELLSQYKGSETLNLQGKFVYPGFIDAHCHFTGYAMDQKDLILKPYRTAAQIIQACSTHHQLTSATWITCRQYDETKFPSSDRITRTLLDQHFPNLPVFIMRIDGHAAVCNSVALARAHVYANTKIQGGNIEQQNGQLTGWLTDKAMDAVVSLLPQISAKEAQLAYVKTEQEFFRYGLTAFTDCMVEYKWLQAVEETQRSKQPLAIKGALVLTLSKQNVDQYLYQKRKTAWPILGFKLFADGSLGSHGACLLQPYTDKKTNGYLIKTTDSIRWWANQLFKTDYQFFVHAIGDSTNRTVLQIFQEVLPATNQRRWRIEHAQVVHPKDLYLFNESQSIASVQPTHATSDHAWAEDRLGKDRLPHGYAYRNLHQVSPCLPLGTDFPVENLNPMHTFIAAVFRTTPHGEPAVGFMPEQALSRKESLRGMTIYPAYAMFREKEIGSLEKNKAADFVILSTDLMQANRIAIANTLPEAVYVNGKKVSK